MRLKEAALRYPDVCLRARPLRCIDISILRRSADLSNAGTFGTCHPSAVYRLNP